ncbi:hypothetical protein, partial [Gluconobacter sp. P1D12_c]|uniref:hypothetical protein n=1 Tax=Gluconobacter sp. P1D12_c TaxID=2762614 RepID=UPI00207B27C6
MTRLKTPKDRLREDQAEQVRQAVLRFLDSPDFDHDALGRVMVTVQRITTPAPGTTEPFVMIRPAQNRAVTLWLMKNSKRPMKAVDVWTILFVLLFPLTGQMMLTREEIAEKVGIRVNEVTAIMNELVKFGAIFSERETVAGMRG